MDIENKDDVADLVRLLRYMPKSHESAAADLIEKLLAEREHLMAQEPVTYLMEINGKINPRLSLGYIGSGDSHEKVVAVPVYRRPVPAQQVATEWEYCPECGSEDIHYEEGRHKQCNNCHQEWYSDIDYTEVVMGNLAKRFAQPSPAVAVPENPDSASFNSDYRAGFSVCSAFYQRALRDAGFGLRNPSPRITEQDAREIVTAWARHLDDDDAIQLPDFEWSHPHWKEVLRALLNKLNAKTERD